MFLIAVELTGEDRPVNKIDGALAVFLIRLPFSDISFAIGVEVHTLTLLLVLVPVSNVEFAVEIVKLSLPVFHMVQPLALVAISVLELVSAGSVPFFLNHLPDELVLVRVLDVDEGRALLLAFFVDSNKPFD